MFNYLQLIRSKFEVLNKFYVKEDEIFDMLSIEFSKVHSFYLQQISIKKTPGCLGIIVIAFFNPTCQDAQSNCKVLIGMFMLESRLIVNSYCLERTVGLLYSVLVLGYCLKKFSNFIIAVLLALMDNLRLRVATTL